MIKDLEKVGDRITLILEDYPHTRDSDKLLWLAYNVGFNNLLDVLAPEKYEEFKSWLLKSQTPVFESLSRARRKIQETRPELAGDKEKRLAEAEAVRVWSRD